MASSEGKRTFDPKWTLAARNAPRILAVYTTERRIVIGSSAMAARVRAVVPATAEILAIEVPEWQLHILLDRFRQRMPVMQSAQPKNANGPEAVAATGP
jgi:hypothetical protein